MKKLNFKHPKFIKSALHAKDYPPCVDSRGRLLPEIAVIGRSNVGKSSLLNSLFHEKSLFKTSSTPGKTQLLNFFLLDGKLSFVDLPGYGYAKVPGQVKKNWGESIETYLSQRENLQLVLWLLDSRREPSGEDLIMGKWLSANLINVIIVLTKIDLLKSIEIQKQEDHILSCISSIFKPRLNKETPIVLYSSVKNEGRLHLINQIEKCLY